MMNQFLMLLTALFIVRPSSAQQLKNQAEELADIRPGKYTAYLAKKDGDKYIGGIDDLWYEFKRAENYKAHPTAGQKEVYMVLGKSKTHPNERYETMLVPDKVAFPVTYVMRTYEGNKKLQEDIGYVYKLEREKPTKRVVFLDRTVYCLEDYIDKDNYQLVSILEFEEKPMSSFKMMTASMKSPKKLQAMQPHKKLQAYLDEATELQEAAYTEWLQTPANKTWEENSRAKYELMMKVIRQMSDDWRNSDEYKRIQANNARADRAKAASTVTIINDTGSTVYIFQEGSRNGTRISANGSGSADCSKSLYYSYSGKSALNGNGTKFYTANSSCGGSISIN